MSNGVAQSLPPAEQECRNELLANENIRKVQFYERTKYSIWNDDAPFTEAFEEKHIYHVLREIKKMVTSKLKMDVLLQVKMNILYKIRPLNSVEKKNENLAILYATPHTGKVEHANSRWQTKN